MDRAVSSGGRWAHACAIVLLAVLPFAAALDAPFTFDDTDYITGSPLLPRPELILASDVPLSPNVALSVRTRVLGRLSFALSYRMGGGTRPPSSARGTSRFTRQTPCSSTSSSCPCWPRRA